MSTSYPPVHLPDTEIRLLHSNQVGDRYRLHIGLPTNYARHNRKYYPVVYLSYSNSLFPLLWFIAGSLNADWELPRMILVGIGYDTDTPIQQARLRERDFLPTPSLKAKHITGYADKFLAFIREELQPFMNANYRTQTDDACYVGHSHGGLFGLYTLFHEPKTFQRFVIGSPSIHYDNQVILTHEEQYANTHMDLSARIFLGVGAREEHDDPLIDPSFQFVSSMQQLARILRQRDYPSLTLETQVFDSESHVSVIPSLFSKGLRFVYE